MTPHGTQNPTEEDEAKIDIAARKYREIRSYLEGLLDADLTESDTRSKVIDPILKEVLGWSEQDILREIIERTDGQYLDYLLHTTQPFLVVEAKRNYLSFEIPKGGRRTFRVDGAIDKSGPLKQAITQARNYAINKGVNFCVATNGMQWVIFRSTNQVGIPWGKHLVVVFRSLLEIESRFTEFYEALSRESAFDGTTGCNIPLEHNKGHIESKYEALNILKLSGSATTNRNSLYPFTRELISKVFQSLDNSNVSDELIRQCYVETGRESGYERGIGDMLRDHVSRLPFDTKLIRTTRKDAGDFGSQIDDLYNFPDQPGEVSLLLGTVGAGKTSFLNRFRKVIARELLDKHFSWTYLSFNEFVESQDTITDYLAQRLRENIQSLFQLENPFSWDVLKAVYRSEIADLREGILNPIYRRSPEEFEIRLVDELKGYFEKPNHYYRILSHLSRREGKRVVIVLDNADQHSPELQNELFQIAKQLAEQLKCCVFISLREESFWKNKDFGVLSAFHATAFQITAPRIDQVLSRRFKFAQLVINGKSEIKVHGRVLQDLGLDTAQVARIIQHLQATILGEDRRYIRFLEYLNPGEVRRSLDFVARFLSSGHTNINSIISNINRSIPPIGFHEFVASIMRGDRLLYQEDYSDVLNLFFVEGKNDENHFNRIAIISRIVCWANENRDSNLKFISSDDLISSCEALGMTAETTYEALGKLVKKRIIASDTLSRETFGSDSFFRATSAAIYYTDELSRNFTYLDLILTDTRIGSPEIRSALNEMSHTIQIESDRLTRLALRLRRCEVFLDYLVSEFRNSRFSDSPKGFDLEILRLPERIRSEFEIQKVEIYENAREAFSRWSQSGS